MSYQEKRTITTIITGALVLAAYCYSALGLYQSGAVAAGDLKEWAIMMLVFIGISVVATVVIQIVFHILLSIALAVKEKIQDNLADDNEIGKRIEREMVEDERDKLIGLKSTWVGIAFAGTGFFLALVSLVLNYSPVVMLNIMFISFSAGSLFEGFAQLYFYRRGIRNG